MQYKIQVLITLVDRGALKSLFSGLFNFCKKVGVDKFNGNGISSIYAMTIYLHNGHLFTQWSSVYTMIIYYTMIIFYFYLHKDHIALLQQDRTNYCRNRITLTATGTWVSRD